MQFVGCFVTVNRCQGGVDVQIVAIGGCLKNTFNRIFKDTSIAMFGLNHGLFIGVALGYILNEAMQCAGITIHGDALTPLPDPAYAAIRMVDSVFDIDGNAFF